MLATRDTSRQLELPQPTSALLTLLRLSVYECRSAPRCAPQAACALLLPDAGAEDFSQALARALSGAMVRRPRIWPPGAVGQSFDEEWLLALAGAIRRDDADSIRFLVERRVRPASRSLICFLLSGLIRHLDKH